MTRQQFQHWVSLIDYLTAKLKPTTAFNKLFTISGEEIRHLKDLSDGESYVAASSVFKPLPYQFKIKGKDWSRSAVPKAKDITNLSSTETMKIYLKKNNFKPLTTNQCWDDSGFDLLRTSHGRVANNHSYPTTGQALPQRSQVAYSQPNISRLQLNQPVFSNGRRSASVDRFRAVDQYNRSNTGPQRYH